MLFTVLVLVAGMISFLSPLNKFMYLLKKAANYQRIIKIVTGLILLFFGVLMVTNKISYLFKLFQDIIPYQLSIGM
jgi:cytochrome c-type biogenesis protein